MARIFIFSLVIASLVSCGKEKGNGDLDMVFYLEYGGKPLVMLDTFKYPVTGQNVSFTRYAAYISNLELIKNDGSKLQVKDIDFLDMTNSHDKNNAANGYSYKLKDIESGDFTGISFGFGVPQDMNAQAPKDYPSENVLSSSANYWSSWKSYIFTRTEGKIDQDKDGSLEDTFALHCGGDSAYYPFEGSKVFHITDGGTTRIEIVLDMEKYFYGNTLYDIVTFPATHSLEHIPAINVLTDNLSVAVTLK